MSPIYFTTSPFMRIVLSSSPFLMRSPLPTSAI